MRFGRHLVKIHGPCAEEAYNRFTVHVHGYRFGTVTKRTPSKTTGIIIYYKIYNYDSFTIKKMSENTKKKKKRFEFSPPRLQLEWIR